MENTKEISYLGKDFTSFKQNLIDFTKQYFPNTYTDFNESDPGMIFLELAAYVGDVLSFYTDTNLKESLLDHATEKANVYDLAYALGYRPNNISPAYVDLDVFQLVPATGTGTNNIPDMEYALVIKPGLILSVQNSAAKFRVADYIDFSTVNIADPDQCVIYSKNNTTGEPTYYLLKKTVTAVSGIPKSVNFTFGSPIPYDKIVLTDTNISEIISVTDSVNDTWYEVPYLAQDLIADSKYSPNATNTNFLLQYKTAAKRFISRLRSDNTTEIRFGAGISSKHNTTVVPGVTSFIAKGDTNVILSDSIDPNNFLYTKTYGQAPANTTLTVTYTMCNGILDNVNANQINIIDNIEFINNVNNVSLNATTLRYCKQSVYVNNPNPAIGGNNAESVDEIKQNAAANFAAQNRIVAPQDYIARVYSMPSRFGSISKAFVQQDSNSKVTDIYVLGYNSSKQLQQFTTTPEHPVLKNLKTYLNEYRMLSEQISLKQASVINIGIEFEITVLPNYNNNEILLKCINELKNLFNIDRWQINQPIIIADITTAIANIKGVQSVIKINFTSKNGETNYFNKSYDIVAATKSGVIYPSMDPSIFEIKFPDADIKGKVISY